MTWPTYSGRLELSHQGGLYGHHDLQRHFLGSIENPATSLQIRPSDERSYRILLDVWLAEQRRRGRELAGKGPR
jgi:hypothetical protein